MTSIRAAHLGFAHAGGAPIFDDISFHLGSGWTGLVGPNGAGKTTLLELIRGALEPASGSIERVPASPVVWCPQRIDEVDDTIETFANAWTPEAMKWMSRFRLEWDELQRWETLSPGERKRWQIASALERRPEYLVLDEPTNHLDREGRRGLLEALAEFDGVGIVVSHDRAFLDALCSSILWLERGELRQYQGDWAAVRQARSEEHAAAIERLAAAQSKVRKLERQQRDRRAAAANADRAISSRTRMTSIRDSDARSTSAKIRAETAAASASSAAGALIGRIEQARAVAADAAVDQRFGGTLTVDGFASRNVLGSWSIDEVRVPDRLLLADVALQVGAGERVAIGGANGCGKSTLLRAMREEVAPSVEVLFMPQEWTSGEADFVRADLLGSPSEELGQILAFVAALGVDPEQLLRSEKWSPGELRKTCFARAFALNRVELMLLDEPTNHLDIPSRERLEEALSSWPGAVVMVSHDDWFTDEVATSTWVVRRQSLLHDAGR